MWARAGAGGDGTVFASWVPEPGAPASSPIEDDALVVRLKKKTRPKPSPIKTDF